ncbi:MAG: hypothetical protein ABI920_11025 [Casimicrobiaceae bacterium]
MSPPMIPGWLERMAPRCWYALSGDRPDLHLQATPPGTRYLRDNDPARDPRLNPPGSLRERVRHLLGRAPRPPWHGSVGFAAITEAWNSAVYASGLGASGAMVVFGGGHNDYFGSDMHAFDLETREWRRVSDGFTAGSDRDYGEGAVYPDAVYPDGSPLPPHTYDYVQYDPVSNDYLLLKGQTELGRAVKAVPIPHLFNLTTLRWRRGPQHPTAILNSAGCTTWDASRRVLWGHSGDDAGGNAFVGFHPDGANPDGTYGAWSSRHPNKFPGMANHNAMQIVPGGDVIVVSVHAANALFTLDPADPARPALPLAAEGEKPALHPFASLQYLPGSDRLVYFSPLDAGTIHTIAPADASHPNAGRSTWRWTAHRPVQEASSLAITAHDAHSPGSRAHAFGRFRVATFDGIEIAILVRSYDAPVLAWRFD